MVLETRELQFKNLLSPGDGFNESPSPTLSLLPPSQSGSSKPEAVANVARPRNQLTIFYAGSVNVYDNISEDKANAIMILAGNSANGNIIQALSGLEAAPTPTPANPGLGFPEPAQKVRKLQAMASPAQNNLILSLNAHLARPTTGNGLTIPHVACSPVAAQAGLPQARKASLTRFLQRRKERAIQQKMEFGEEKNTSDSAGNKLDCSAPPEEHYATLKKDIGIEA